jgi:hypothetical protein
MSVNETVIMDEARRLGIRYGEERSIWSAIEKALNDLINARECASKPLNNAQPTKMEALDFFRLVSMVIPEAITDGIVDACKTQFMACNAASKIAIPQIFAMSHRTDTIQFLEDVVNGIEDLQAWERKAALEAIQVLKGEWEIGWGNCQGRWIYRYIKAKE